MSYYIIGGILAFLLVSFFFRSLSVVFKILINTILGALALYILNELGIILNLGTIDITPGSAFITGFFGLPGVFFLIIFKIFF